MNTQAIIFMIFGCSLIWGGLAGSILFSVKKSRDAKS